MEKHIRPKLRPNGSVIVHPAKSEKAYDRMYSREQLRKELLNYDHKFSMLPASEEVFNKWFDKNYPE